MPRKAFPRQAIASLGVTVTLLASGAALCAPAGAAAVPARSPLAASLQASATAGMTWAGREAVVAPRVRPVLTTGVRTTALTPAAPGLVELTVAQVYAHALLLLTNVQRTLHGLPALRWDSCATRYAARQNAVIVRNRALSHSDLHVVVAGCAARGGSENVAYGQVSAATIFGLLMNSPGHRANILRSTSTHIGIVSTKAADGRWYSTQVFLSR